MRWESVSAAHRPHRCSRRRRFPDRAGVPGAGTGSGRGRVDSSVETGSGGCRAQHGEGSGAPARRGLPSPAPVVGRHRPQPGATSGSRWMAGSRSSMSSAWTARRSTVRFCKTRPSFAGSSRRTSVGICLRFPTSPGRAARPNYARCRTRGSVWSPTVQYDASASGDFAPIAATECVATTAVILARASGWVSRGGCNRSRRSGWSRRADGPAPASASQPLIGVRWPSASTTTSQARSERSGRLADSSAV